PPRFGPPAREGWRAVLSLRPPAAATRAPRLSFWPRLLSSMGDPHRPFRLAPHPPRGHGAESRVPCRPLCYNSRHQSQVESRILATCDLQLATFNGDIMTHSSIPVLDFGGQTAQLIVRAVPEPWVHS